MASAALWIGCQPQMRGWRLAGGGAAGAWLLAAHGGSSVAAVAARSAQPAAEQQRLAVGTALGPRAAWSE
jgi:hypothetical protein